MADQRARVIVHFDGAMQQRLKEAARRDRRSLARYIQVRIEKAVSQELAETTVVRAGEYRSEEEDDV